jgi:hypothetical protein
MEEWKMRLNTLIEQHDLIDAEAAEKRIDYYFLKHPTPIAFWNKDGKYWSQVSGGMFVVPKMAAKVRRML